MAKGEAIMKHKIVRGRYVITNASQLPEGGLVEHGAVAIEGDKVISVGPFDSLARQYPNAEVIGSNRHIVLPGLVNAHHHGHGLSGIQIGALDDYLELWLLDWLTMKPLDLYLDTLYANMRMIRSGVTTVLHSSYARVPGEIESETEAALRAYADAGLRVAYAVGIEDRLAFVHHNEQRFLASLPNDIRQRVQKALATTPEYVDAYFALVDRLAAAYADHPLINVLYGPNWPVWCSDELLRRISEAAGRSGLGIHIHVLESPFERVSAARQYSKSAVEHLEEVGLLGPNTSLAHGVWLSERDMNVCARTGASICHNASSNLRLRCGIAPVRRMLEVGVNVAIGMDGYGINNDDDMIQEMRLVADLHRLPCGRRLTWAPGPSDILKMATVNGARAACMEGKVGVLEEGSLADAVLVDFSRLSEPYLDPRVHPVDALLYLGKSQHVDSVLIGGALVYANGKFLNLDETQIARDLAAAAEASLPPDFEEFRRLTDAVRESVRGFFEEVDGDANFDPFYTVNSRS